jgi:hypothetical protein
MRLSIRPVDADGGTMEGCLSAPHMPLYDKGVVSLRRICHYKAPYMYAPRRQQFALITISHQCETV